SREPAGDAALQLEILRRAEREVHELRDEEGADAALAAAARCDAAVDALFGTGLTRPLSGHFARLVEGLDALGVPLAAVDLPSGLDGSRAEILGPHAKADLTVTFAAPKIAHVLPPACDAMGEIEVVDLAIPPELVAEAPGSWHLLTQAETSAELMAAPPGAHKGTFGHALVVGGGRGGSGAIALTARAAVRSGAGLVTAGVPSSLGPAVDRASAESMILPLPESAGALAEEAAAEILAAARGKQALALGPGLGRSEGARTAVRRAICESLAPLVIDADGLNACAGHLEIFAGLEVPAILTPHPGEMARLLDSAVPAVEGDRPQAALELAARTGATVVLKGRRSLIAAPGGELWVNPTGNSGMATGGSGDVLTGVLAALLAQGYGPESAARVGVYAHGLAGDLALPEKGRAGLAAGDLIAFLPAAWRALEDPA
ncbi:MAG: NAD(P)H-hydrate dehydratase, partial [Acidobacteriota bacterium]